MRVALVTGSHGRHQYIATEIQKISSESMIIIEDTPLVESPHFLKRQRYERQILTISETAQSALSASATTAAQNQINSDDRLVEKLNAFNPSFIFFYGCSIIKKPLITRLNGILINIHLGLSPYYRGAGTNFWPLYNGFPEFVGVTYHALTEKVDNGYIFLQRRALPDSANNVHQYGLNLIKKIPSDLRLILENRDYIVNQEHEFKFLDQPRYIYRKKDFSDEHAEYVDERFLDIIKDYIENKVERDKAVPIKDCGSLGWL